MNLATTLESTVMKEPIEWLVDRMPVVIAIVITIMIIIICYTCNYLKMKKQKDTNHKIK